MAESSAQLTPTDILKRFAACSVCVGYCRESGRQQIADDIQDDIFKIAQLLRMVDSEWIGALFDLAEDHDDLWVKYFALISVGRMDRQRVIDELEALSAAETGLAPAAARLAVLQLRQELPSS